MRERLRILRKIKFSTITYGLFFAVFTTPIVYTIVTWLFNIDRNKYNIDNLGVFYIPILAILFYFMYRQADPLDPKTTTNRDIGDREVASKIELSERRIYQDVKRELFERAEKELVGTELVTKVLERKLEDGIVVTLDRAIKTRLDGAASKLHALNHIDETLGRIRIKLDGPSSRAERAAGISRILAYAFAVFGVVLATYRVVSLDLPQPPTTTYDWPAVAMKAGPWVGLVLLVEFTALLFLRFYNRSIELQRYFTRELAGIESQFLGLKVAIDVGGRIDGVRASAALLKVEPASFVEDKEGELSTLTKAIESMADVIQKLKPAAEAGA
ncbi:hypothetical protein [Rhizobium sophoriradicis]|uniref:Uncharacterized protein n=1 Tax=Rhizobium sophoriradicis TaxID=1535245 RepID=A0A2A5KSI1_9HYPH|nr:hypothetical protein [Rhizobium sophoriradicis]PCK80014.1 hypothetical protein CPT34_15745 [Rhizobium sophoriradicis]